MEQRTPRAGLDAVRVNPYTVPADQQGWRGLDLPGNHKRKWYTIVHNDRVLVTALVTLPGEVSVRHAHESGELSIHYLGDLRPMVTWNPPGYFHGGVQQGQSPSASVDGQLADALKAVQKQPELAMLAEHVVGLEHQLEEMRQQLAGLAQPQLAPRLIIDVIFPPFKTIIDDPLYAEKTVVTGQWYD